jgi:hypothetical protein
MWELVSSDQLEIIPRGMLASRNPHPNPPQGEGIQGYGLDPNGRGCKGKQRAARFVRVHPLAPAGNRLPPLGWLS